MRVCDRQARRVSKFLRLCVVTHYFISFLPKFQRGLLREVVVFIIIFSFVNRHTPHNNIIFLFSRNIILLAFMTISNIFC